MSEDENTTGALAGTLLPPFLAVIAVTAILTALFVWLGPDESGTRMLSVGKPAPTSQDAPSPTTTAPASSPPASSPPASSPAPATSTAPQSEVPVPDRPEVVVLNQSGSGGLAARVTRRVSEAGWTVKQTGSFRGTVSTTTVYYPRGKQAQARALAKDLPGKPRVMERFSNLSDTRLTIVLTDDYGS